MKKLAVLFLLSIFLFNTAGYYIVFKTVQYQVKSDIQNEIRSGSSKFEKLAINKRNLSSIEWLESGKEMRYNNQLYDIVKSEETSTTIIFYCINDTKEKSLFSRLEDHIKTHLLPTNPVKNDSSKKLIDTVTKLYFSNAFSFSYTHTHTDVLFYTQHFNYISELIEIKSPPPEFI